MFKNAFPFRLASDHELTPQTLEEALHARRHAPPGSQDMKTVGWVSPREDGALLYSVQGQHLACMAIEEKVLPGAVVNRKVEERVADLERQQGFKPGRKQIKEIKEGVIHELLPKAFVKLTKIFVWFDLKNNWMAAEAKPDDVLDLLHDGLETYPVRMIATEMSPSSAMREWLMGEDPEGFSVDDSCELKDPETKAAVKYSSLNLDRQDVREHLQEGKTPVSLALTHGDAVSFVLTDKFAIKKITALDLEDDASNDADAFDNQFYLLTQNLAGVCEGLIAVLGGEAA